MTKAKTIEKLIQTTKDATSLRELFQFIGQFQDLTRQKPQRKSNHNLFLEFLEGVKGALKKLADDYEEDERNRGRVKALEETVAVVTRLLWLILETPSNGNHSPAMKKLNAFVDQFARDPHPLKLQWAVCTTH